MPPASRAPGYRVSDHTAGTGLAKRDSTESAAVELDTVSSGQGGEAPDRSSTERKGREQWARPVRMRMVLSEAKLACCGPRHLRYPRPLPHLMAIKPRDQGKQISLVWRRSAASARTS